MGLDAQGRAALTYWGTIQASVTEHASTADVWAGIRAAQAAYGANAPRVTLQGLNQVRSIAAGIRNSSDMFGAARALEQDTGLRQGITGAMVSTAPWSRDAQTLSTLADYQVRFEAQTIGPDGAAATQWLTAMYPAGSLPLTVGDLTDALADYGPATGSLGDSALTGVGAVQIIAV